MRVLSKISGVIEIKDAKVGTTGETPIFASKTPATAVQPNCGRDFWFTRPNVENSRLLRLQKHNSIEPETGKILTNC
jgi:hypothetical protein